MYVCIILRPVRMTRDPLYGYRTGRAVTIYWVAGYNAFAVQCEGQLGGFYALTG